VNRQIAAQREMALRHLAKKRILPFARRFYPDYLAGWAHKVIAANLERFLRETLTKRSPRLMIFMPPQTGKNLAHDTPVLTANRGWTTHGELRVGDDVFHPSGRPVRVLALSEDAPAEYEVTFSDGEIITAHARHEWRVYDRKKNGYPEVVIETQDMFADYWIGSKGKRGGRARWQLPEHAALSFQEQELPISPYVLGVWLGDGTYTAANITNSEEDAVVFQQAFERLGYSHSGVNTHKQYGTHRTNLGHTGLYSQLRQENLLGNKHVPEAYIRASTEQRLELLAGIIDSDGHVDPKGRVIITTTSEQIKNGVLDLATTLGQRPTCRSESPSLSTSGIQGTKELFIIAFQPTVEIPTRLPRKRIHRTLDSRRRRSIRGVRKIAPKPGRCIRVDSPDGMYLVGKSLIPTHNSMLVSDIFPSWALGLAPHLRFILTSYSVSLPIRFSRYNRERVKSEPYRTLFPGTSIHPEIMSAEHWETTERGGFRAVGVGGSITGHGAEIILVDDPFKDYEEAHSETIREMVHNWYPTTLRTRLQPGGGIINVNTRWHDDDLSGWLLRQDKENREEGKPESQLENWRVLSLPALATQNEFVDRDFIMHYEPAPDRVLVRETGQPLHEERHDAEEWLCRKAGATKQQWSSLYQQNPVPDTGDFFTRADFQFYTSVPELHHYPVYFAWDLAVGERKNNDYTVGMAGVVIPRDGLNCLYLLDMFRGRVRDLELYEAVVNMYLKYRRNAARIGMEYGQLFLSVERPILEAFRKYGATPGWDRSLKPVSDKRVRATPARSWMQHHRVYFPKDAPWTEVAMNEMLRFDAGVHDDIVDALAWLVRMVHSMPTVKAFGENKKIDAWGFKPLEAQIRDYARSSRLGGSPTGYMAS